MKKWIGSVLSIVLMLQLSTITAVADVVNTTIEYDSTQDETSMVYTNVDVEAERAELYSVQLPKKVVLDVVDTTATFAYSVVVNGEISSNHYVRVIPLTGATITDESETFVIPLTVEQEKRRWDYTEVAESLDANTTTGAFTAENMEPGKYKGSVRYLITCDDGGMWNAATCTTPATRVGLDVNDDGVIAEEEKDEVNGINKTRGVALGHKFADGDTAFPSTCLRCNKPIYGISTPEQLVTFGANVDNGNTYSGATVELLADIDMTGIDFDPIGSEIGSTYFNGNFNGNGHSISNLSINKEYAKDTKVGLFAQLANNCVVSNLILHNPKIMVNQTTKNSVYAGFVVGSFNGYGAGSVITNVHVRNGVLNVGTIDTNTHGMYLGGLAGMQYGGTVNNCSVVGNLILDAIACLNGGVSGLCTVSSSTVVQNCYTAVQCVVATTDVDISAISSVSSSAITNCVYNKDLCTSTVGTGYTTDEMKSETVINILNTDNDMQWTLDIENVNVGYPVIK